MKIKEIREKVFLTQAQFAQELGICVSTVQQWEQRGIEPSLRMKAKIDRFCKERGIKYETN